MHDVIRGKCIGPDGALQFEWNGTRSGGFSDGVVGVWLVVI